MEPVRQETEILPQRTVYSCSRNLSILLTEMSFRRDVGMVHDRCASLFRHDVATKSDSDFIQVKYGLNSFLPLVLS